MVLVAVFGGGYWLGHSTGSDDKQESQADGQGTASEPGGIVVTPEQAANARARGTDAEAKSAVITAAEAMETCATDNNGTYSNCDKETLTTIVPTLANVGDRLKVASLAATLYDVSVESASTGNTFTITRQPNGTTIRSCVKPNTSGCDSSGGW